MGVYPGISPFRPLFERPCGGFPGCLRTTVFAGQQLIELEKEQPQAKPLDKQVILDRIQGIEQTMAHGTNKEKRDFIRAFIHSIEFDPDEGQAYINFFADPFRTTKVKTGDSQEPPVSILDGGDTRI